MSVVVSVEDAGVCRKQLKIEVPGPAVEAETRRVAQEYRKAARIPGFRKGKVPLGVVHKRFEEEIRKEVIDRLVPRYWHQAEAESGLDPLMPPTVEQVDFESGESLTFDAVVEVRPEITLGDLDSFDLPEPATEASEQEIAEAIEDLRRGVAEWIDADRAAARGDLVVGKIELVPDAADDEAAAEPQPVSFEVGDQNVWEELTLAVTGQSAGSSADFVRREQLPPAAEGDPPGEEMRKYKIEIEGVRERDLPEVDDEFAAKVGEFESLEAMREALTKRLSARKAQESRRARERAVLDQLRERHPLELPEGVVQRETENMLRSYAENLAQQGVDPEKADIDWQRLFEQTLPQGKLEVQARLLLDAAVEKLEITVSEDEFETSLATLAKMQGKSTPSVRQALDRAGRLGELRTQLARDKVIKRFLGEADETAEKSADEPEKED
jgi:trigger factor